MAERASRRPRGALERQILACLSGSDHPLTASEVLAELDGGLAYTTVMTTLTRLHDKGVLRREPVGRAYAYSLAADPDEMPSITVAQRMRRLLESRDDRAGVLAHFVADLSPEDETVLAGLLAELRDDGASGTDPGTGPGTDPDRAPS